MNDTKLNPTNQRLVWVDWMKTLAMYFIITGHCNVPGNKYIYAFSVPCFFVLSGFLTKRESNPKVFWKKTWWNLVVPMIILLLIHIAYVCALDLLQGTFEINYLWQCLCNALIGNQGQDTKGGLGVLWFVYTLIICKAIIQYTPAAKERFVLPLLSVSMLVGCYILNGKGVVVYNAIVDVLLAMPFIAVGYFTKPFKGKLTLLCKKWIPLMFIVGIIGVWFCGSSNDIVYLYSCSYGRNLFYCIIGALCGTVLLYAISRLAESYLQRFVNIVGGGTLIILGLHIMVMSIINMLFPIYGLFKYGEALIILLLLVPVIVFCKNHFKLLYGAKR